MLPTFSHPSAPLLHNCPCTGVCTAVRRGAGGRQAPAPRLTDHLHRRGGDQPLPTVVSGPVTAGPWARRPRQWALRKAQAGSQGWQLRFCRADTRVTHLDAVSHSADTNTPINKSPRKGKHRAFMVSTASFPSYHTIRHCCPEASPHKGAGRYLLPSPLACGFCLLRTSEVKTLSPYSEDGCPCLFAFPQSARPL